MRIDYTVVFKRDWRVGSGQAAGRYLDDLVRRDGHRLPFVPGSTMRGIVGDALGRLSKTLELSCCDGSAERDQKGKLGELCGVTRPGVCPLCLLTGSPHRPAKTRWGPARLVIEGPGGNPVWEPRARRKVAHQAAMAPELLTRAHPRTAIDEQSGRAEEEHLFSLEEARAGLELAGSVELDPDLPAREVSLLVGALRFVRAIGGGRRRGLGACRIRIDRAELAPYFASWEEAVSALDSGGASGSSESLEAAQPARAASPRLEALPRDGGPIHLRLDARVIGEVAAGGRPEAGNVVSGLPYLPGSTLRGALAALWQGQVGSEEFLRCFVSGRIRFGFLYPPDAQRIARPMPRSLYTCKHRPGSLASFRHGLVDLLLQPKVTQCPQEDCLARLIPAGAVFDAASQSDSRLALSPHNRIEPGSQTVRQGGLFAYEGLGEGTTLGGFLAADAPEDLEALLAGLGLELRQPFELRVGRRKGALGHLDCTLEVASGTPSGVGLFPDAYEVPHEWPETDRLRVDLLTPAIVVDEHLRFRESLAPADLGLELPAFAGSFGASQTLAGWHGARGLPKSSQLAVAAGSSYLVERPPQGAEKALKALRSAARAGVGLRRVEGFGVVSVSTVTRRQLDEVLA